MFYVARWYDPVLGRFAQADSIVPGAGHPLAWDRYAYTLNNPVRYTDPTGHFYYDPGCECMVDNGVPEYQFEENLTHYRNYNEFDRSNTDLFIKTREGIAAGIRLDFSATTGKLPFANQGIGIDINLDTVYFSSTGEGAVFITPGFQEGTTPGVDFSGGLLYGWNFDDPSDYAGSSLSHGGNVPVIPLGITVEGDVSFSSTPNENGTIPTVVYVGTGPISSEVGGFVSTGPTFNLTDMPGRIASWFMNLFR